MPNDNDDLFTRVAQAIIREATSDPEFYKKFDKGLNQKGTAPASEKISKELSSKQRASGGASSPIPKKTIKKIVVKPKKSPSK